MYHSLYKKLVLWIQRLDLHHRRLCFLQNVIMRCSQPMTGPNGKRCKEDERLVNAVLGIGRRGYILDTRSTTMAKLATAKGVLLGNLQGNVF